MKDTNLCASLYVDLNAACGLSLFSNVDASAPGPSFFLHASKAAPFRESSAPKNLPDHQCSNRRLGDSAEDMALLLLKLSLEQEMKIESSGWHSMNHLASFCPRFRPSPRSADRIRPSPRPDARQTLSFDLGRLVIVRLLLYI